MNKTDKLIKFLKENPECVDKLAEVFTSPKEDKEQELVPWDASMSGFFLLFPTGHIEHYKAPDLNRHRHPYCFKTREDAEQMRDYRKVIYKLRMQTKGFIPDWESTSQSKWCVFYTVSHKGMVTSSVKNCNEGGGVYFRIEEDAQVLKKVDNTAYRTFFNDWLDAEIECEALFEKDGLYYADNPDELDEDEEE